MSLDIESLLWRLPKELSEAEQKVASRAAAKRKLFVFLRQCQGELFDEPFQRELIEMYRQTGAGKVPVAPGLLAMVTLLQAYTGVGDQEAVELTLDSRRWQLVLGRLGSEEVACGQATLHDFRMRLLSTGLYLRLLERTVELARSRGGFSAAALRAALDSSPLWGHGRVEDTVNLLGHAARQVLACVAELSQQTVAQVIEQMGLELFDAPSLKAALDVNWDDAEQKQQALNRLCTELSSLQHWLSEYLPEAQQPPPLSAALTTLQRLMEQDLEPDPNGGQQIKDGVAKDRQISIDDPEMRHGRKSAKRRIDGYKRHILRDLDEQLIVAADVAPANEPDYQALEPILIASELQYRELTELHIDRAYLGSPCIGFLDTHGVRIVCKPWPAQAPNGHFSKRDFQIDLEHLQATCPAGVRVPIRLGSTVQFPAESCSACTLREQCTDSVHGRSLSIHAQESLLQRLAVLPTTAEGRQQLRERVAVEHGLAHVSQRQGNHARYNGVDKNRLHLHLVCAIQNLERAQAFTEKGQTAQAAKKQVKVLPRAA